MKRLILSLLIVSLIAPIALALSESEPNDPNDQIKFKRSNEYAGWIIAEERLNKFYEDPGPVKPPYAAQLILHRDHPNQTTASEALKRIQASPLASNLSKEQREFLKTGFAIWVCDGSEDILKHFPTWLYAMTEEDARIMTEAYLDGLRRDVDRKIAEFRNELAMHKEELQKAENVLPAKAKELEGAKREYEKAKNTVHEFDDDPAEGARETIREMKNVLDKLQIELRGIREKLATIEKFREGEDKKSLPHQLQLKLDEMFVEQMIELSSLEARQDMAEVIVGRERRFLETYSKWETLMNEVRILRGEIGAHLKSIQRLSEILEDSPPSLQPPKVYQNKVLIHRIKGSTAPEDVERYLERLSMDDSAQYRGNPLDVHLREIRKFLRLVREGELRLEPTLLARLKEAEQKLEEMKVEELLGKVGAVDWDAMSAEAFRKTPVQYHRHAREAKDYLRRIDDGQLHATPAQIDRLKELVKKWERAAERAEEN